MWIVWIMMVLGCLLADAWRLVLVIVLPLARLVLRLVLGRDLDVHRAHLKGLLVLVHGWHGDLAQARLLVVALGLLARRLVAL